MEAGPQRAKAKVKKELQRGIVHWQPPPQCGENEESHEVHKTWLQKEWRKLTKDKSEITKRMDLTYPYENFGPDRDGIRPDFGGNTVDRTKHQQNKNRAKKMSGSKLISQTNVTLVSGSRQPHKTLTGTEQEPNNLKLLFQI